MLGRVFHIGKGNEGFELTGITQMMSEPSASKPTLSSRFGGGGYDESAAEKAMTYFPVPNNNGYNR